MDEQIPRNKVAKYRIECASEEGRGKLLRFETWLQT
jgi:hypothetical protein